jgi:hypothetical protein
MGEPFRLFFRPADLAATTRRLGFAELEDVGREELNARYLSDRADGLRLRGGIGRIMRARKVPVPVN